MRFIHDQLSTKVLNFISSPPTQPAMNICFQNSSRTALEKTSSLMTSMQQIDLNPKMFSYENYTWNLMIEKLPSCYLFIGQW